MHREGGTVRPSNAETVGIGGLMTALPFQGGSGAWPLRKTAAPLLLQSSAEVEDYQWGSLLSFRTPQLTMLENASKKVLYGTSLCLSQRHSGWTDGVTIFRIIGARLFPM